jgi:hypothetical protein
MDVDGAISQYRMPPLEGQFGEGEVMAHLLESCRDLLGPLKLFWCTSLSTLWLSRHPDYQESTRQPAVGVWTDGVMVELTYQESWQDGPLFRVREDRARCRPEHARPALAEFVNRLQPESS